MLRIPIGDCRGAFRLSEDILDEQGRMLIKAGTALDDRLRDRLRDRGITELPLALPYEDRKLPGSTLTDAQETALYQAARNALTELLFLTGDGVEFRRTLYEAVEPAARAVFDRYRGEVSGATKGRSLFISPRPVGCLSNAFYEHAKNMALAAMVCAADYFAGSKQHLSEILKAGVAGILHDCGMLESPENPPDPAFRSDNPRRDWLTLHPQAGFERARPLFSNTESDVLKAILQHEEQGMSRGYPARLKLDDLTPLARILSALEYLYSVTEECLAEERVPPAQALLCLNGESGLAFDPKIVQILNYRYCPFPAGSAVQLAPATMLRVESIGFARTRPAQGDVIADGMAQLAEGSDIPNTPVKVRPFVIREDGSLEWGPLREIRRSTDCANWKLAGTSELLKRCRLT